MPAKNTHKFDLDGVAAYIKENAGVRYPCYKLSNVFDCTSEEMRDVLTQLVANHHVIQCIQLRQKVYFVRTESEQRLLNKMDNTPKAMKPYNPSGPEWDRVNQRLAEFREIKSVQITQENV